MYQTEMTTEARSLAIGFSSIELFVEIMAVVLLGSAFIVDKIQER